MIGSDHSEDRDRYEKYYQNILQRNFLCWCKLNESIPEHNLIEDIGVGETVQGWIHFIIPN
jgi:hypothetical protein